MRKDLLMRIYSFDWDEKNESHIERHGVAIFEIEEVILFHDPLYQRSRDNKYIAYGITEEGRYLFIVFTAKSRGKIRVITARDMVQKERRYYKKRKGVK
ncbi:BrnT family toxin [Candidatus Auribacterota bacterium]